MNWTQEQRKKAATEMRALICCASVEGDYGDWTAIGGWAQRCLIDIACQRNELLEALMWASECIEPHMIEHYPHKIEEIREAIAKVNAL